MKLHPNEVDFRLEGTTADELSADTKKLTQYTVSAIQLGPAYTEALGEQLKRQGVLSNARV